MSKSKTIREWLNELPEPIRSRAIRNTKNDTFILMNFKVVDLSEAIWGAFVWHETPEGHMFWKRVSMGETPELPEYLNQKG